MTEKEIKEAETKKPTAKELPFLLRIALVRKGVSSQGMKPSGRVKGVSKTTGKEIGYSFFQLDDFLPKANELCAAYGVLPVFNITIKLHEGCSTPSEVATLTVYDCYSEKTLEYEIPTEDVTNTQTRIQGLGAKSTFLKRYLYMNFLEIAEKDFVEASSNVGSGSKSGEMKAIYGKRTD